MRHISGPATKVLRPAARQRGLGNMALIQHWADIVGAQYARNCRPIRLQWPRAHADGQEPACVLTIAVAPAQALALQHDTARLLERINDVFGYRAVTRIRVVQAGPAVAAGPSPQKRRVTPREPSKAQVAEFSAIGNPALRTALARLKRGIGAK